MYESGFPVGESGNIGTIVAVGFLLLHRTEFENPSSSFKKQEGSF
jgi:hypothetical protein